MRPEEIHTSVLLEETMASLDLADGETVVDATLGLGGHSFAILERFAGVRVIGIDRDSQAIGLASERLSRFGDRFTALHADYADIRRVLSGIGVSEVDAVLADLGVSSMQFDSPERGFSFRFDAPLDMRMNAGSQEETAAELLERLSEEEIADIIYRYGEERKSRKIARWIVAKREWGEAVRTTGELAALVEKALGRGKQDRIHPATRTFQALRIAVNHELESLERFIDESIDLLKPDGRFAVITFHSLEDRIVKHRFQTRAGRCSCPPRLPVCTCGARKDVELVTKRPVVAGEEETGVNPRARSAKLRVCRRIS
jgi:16S rRNA (cytosine1402-N4)-methyltransferase